MQFHLNVTCQSQTFRHNSSEVRFIMDWIFQKSNLDPIKQIGFIIYIYFN